MRKLFKQSKNILGVLTRGTDYIARKPKQHPIPPNVSILINDVKEMDNKYKYDYIFFSTEDEFIRINFTKHFKYKLKQVKPNVNVKYNLYLINIIILSKCLDIITAKCSGTAGIFVLSNGFRNIKIYELGYY